MHREDDAGSRRDLGQYLRQVRERQGRTLEDIAEETRIRRDYLEALERGAYDIFPGEYWARQFLRTYAATLGVDTAAAAQAAFGDGTGSSRRPRAGSAGGSAASMARPASTVRAGSVADHAGGRAGAASPHEGERRQAASASTGDGRGEGAAPVRAASPVGRPAATGTGRGRAKGGRRIASAALAETVPATSRRAARRRSRGGAWATGGLTVAAAVVVALIAVALWPRSAKAPTRSTLGPPSATSARVKRPPVHKPQGHAGSTTAHSGGQVGTSRTHAPAKHGGSQSGSARAKPHPATPPAPKSSVVANGLVRTASGTYLVSAPSLTATLRLGFLSWIRVNADGKQAIWKEEPGHFTDTFTAAHTLAIYLGFPQGSTLTVDGHILTLSTRNPEWLIFRTASPAAKAGG